MDAAREGWTVIFPIRHAVTASVWSMIRGFMRQLQRIKRQPYPAAGQSLFWRTPGEFPVPGAVNRAYFFNPFSVELLQKVIRRILDSWYEVSREIRLFFYYPSDEYLAYLMTVDELVFADEIDCRELFDGNDARERIVEFVLE